MTSAVIRLYPAYTTVEAVRRELPSRFREDDLTTETLRDHIDSMANLLDSQLSRYYRLPAPPLAPPDGTGGLNEQGLPLTFTPSTLEYLNRLMAVQEGLVLLRDLRQNEQDGQSWYQKEIERVLEQLRNGEQFLTYPFVHPDGRPWYVPLAEGSPLFGQHPLSAQRRVNYRFPDRTFTADSMRRWNG